MVWEILHEMYLDLHIKSHISNALSLFSTDAFIALASMP